MGNRYGVNAVATFPRQTVPVNRTDTSWVGLEGGDALVECEDMFRWQSDKHVYGMCSTDPQRVLLVIAHGGVKRLTRSKPK